MPHRDCFIMMGVGGIFILLGLATIFWGKREEKSYYDSISTHRDMREFLEGKPERPEPGALKIGGRIAIIIGLAMVVMGGAFWLWG
jgi:hypothetical protein